MIMNKLIQYDYIKECFHKYNIIGINWGNSGKIMFIVGYSDFSCEEINSSPNYIISGTSLFSFSLSLIKSSQIKFAEKFYMNFMQAIKTNIHLANVSEAFSNKQINFKEFSEIPEVISCIERLRSQVKELEKDLKSEREIRRVKELKSEFKANVRSFVKRYHLSKNDVNIIINDCLKEMEIEDVMKV